MCFVCFLDIFILRLGVQCVHEHELKSKANGNLFVLPFLRCFFFCVHLFLVSKLLINKYIANIIQWNALQYILFLWILKFRLLLLIFNLKDQYHCVGDFRYGLCPPNKSHYHVKYIKREREKRGVKTNFMKLYADTKCNSKTKTNFTSSRGINTCNIMSNMYIYIEQNCFFSSRFFTLQKNACNV